MRYVSTLVVMVVLVAASVAFVVRRERRQNALFQPGQEGAAGHVLFDSSTPAPGTPPVLWPAPPFALVDQNNATITDQDLRGHVWIADFIFTQCTTACPVMTARMRLLQRGLTEPSIRFVSFSVDSVNDTPAALKAYDTLWQGDANRWYLLSNTFASLDAVAKGMKVSFHSTGDPLNPIAHSSTFELVDADNKVRGVYDSQDEVAMQQLVSDAHALLGDTGATSTASSGATAAGAVNPYAGLATVDAGLGKKLFTTVGCMACHSQARIAPRLDGVYGSTVALQNGTHATADTAYLRESIVAPTAKIVVGYGPTMPAYAGHLSDTQVDALVAYIETLKTNPALAQGAAFQAVDPVCHMKLTVVPGDPGPEATFGGNTYFFCSKTCHDKFVADPGKYAIASAVTPASSASGNH